MSIHRCEADLTAIFDTCRRAVRFMLAPSLFHARIERERCLDAAAIRILNDTYQHHAEGLVARAIGAWPVARAAGLVTTVRRRMTALEDWQCVQLAGWILLVTLAVESMLVPAGHHALDRATTLAARGGLTSIAVVLIVGARAVARLASSRGRGKR